MMDALLPTAPPVHFYDTSHHAVLCGLRGFPDRSTKHQRSVTCPSCIERLADRRASARAPVAGEAGAGASAELA